jgi:uncharacterized RDD family membrane protein YckC
VGKKLIKLKVVSSETQQPCTFRDSILRNSTFALGCLLWLVPWVGWIFMVIVSALELVLALGSKEGKRLGDEFARTSVIEEN